MNKSIQVRVLHTQGCPNVSPTTDVIKKVGEEIGVSLDIKMVMVTSLEQAIELRCLGSPTVQINGMDIEPEARESLSFGLG